MMITNELNIFIETLKKTFPQSKYFIPFFIKNLKLNYRGNHTLQQDRLTIKQLIIVIENFKKISGNSWMQVAPTPGDSDIMPSHKEFNNVQEYVQLVNELKLESNFISPSGKKIKPTQLSTKKILFMNMWALGLLERKICNNNNECAIDDYFNRNNSINAKKTFYKLSDTSIKILNEESLFEKEKIISNQVKRRLVLTDVEILFNLLIDEKISKYKINSISTIEYAFTLNYFGISNNSKEDVINAFLELNLNKKIWLPIIEAKLKDLEEKTKYLGKGNGFIDFGNWKNQVKTKFQFLEMAGNFKVEKNEIFINLYGLDDLYKNKNRSQKEKHLYFENHNIEKGKGFSKNFELHHIIPISYANNAYELMKIDSWKNMILISANKHKEFPIRNNTLIILETNTSNEKLFVKNFIKNENEKVIITNKYDGHYSEKNINKIKEYNDFLLKF